MKGAVLIFLINLLNVVNSKIHVNVNQLNDGRDRDRSPTGTWVKRIVPHGYKSAPYEYDSTLKTIFVPKYRVQKRIDVNAKPELASKEIYLQPSNNYQTGTDKEELSDLLKGLLNAANKKDRDDTDDRKTNYYITSTTFDEKKNIKPTDFNTLQIQNIDYEKPWQQVELKSARRPKIKQEPYFEHFDGLLKTLQKTNNERKRKPNAKYSVYSDGPVWQTVQRNPRAQKKIKSYTRDELLKKYQNAEFEKPRHNSRYLKNNQMNSAGLIVPYTMIMLKNEKKPYNDLNNIFKVIHNLKSTEQRQGSESLTDNLENPDKKAIVEAVKYIEAVIDGLERDEDKTKLKNKTKLLFKSMATYLQNKHNILNKKPPSTLKRISSDINNENGQENANPDLPWGSLKPPIDSELAETDLFNELLHPQKPKPDDGVNSDELSESIHPNIKRTQLSNVEKLLERLRDLVDERQQSEESDDSSAAESYWTPKEPPKKQRSTKTEDLPKTLVGFKQSLNSDSDSDVSAEPEWPVEVIQKHKVQLILPPLNKIEPPKATSYVNPNDEKVHFYIRNLGDLLKIWKFIEGKKANKNPQLRDRPKNSVVLDLEQSHNQHPFNIPHYSIWNYWTYDKNLFHDNCPGEQAKVGNQCIWTPPHRK